MQASRIVIVGGVAGGASCAARLRRLTEKAEIIVYERGNAVSFANCGLPYFVGGIIPVSLWGRQPDTPQPWLTQHHSTCVSLPYCST